MPFVPAHSDQVTHVVSEQNQAPGLWAWLRGRGLKNLSAVQVLDISWFTDSMKEGRPVALEARHRIQVTLAVTADIHSCMFVCVMCVICVDSMCIWYVCVCVLDVYMVVCVCIYGMCRPSGGLRLFEGQGAKRKKGHLLHDMGPHKHRLKIGTVQIEKHYVDITKIFVNGHTIDYVLNVSRV